MMHTQKLISNVDVNVAVSADANNFDASSGADTNSNVDANVYAIVTANYGCG